MTAADAIPGPQRMAERYLGFRLQLPRMYEEQKLEMRHMSFLDYRMLVTGWLDENEW
jgi:hypothetical protein